MSWYKRRLAERTVKTTAIKAILSEVPLSVRTMFGKETWHHGRMSWEERSDGVSAVASRFPVDPQDCIGASKPKIFSRDSDEHPAASSCEARVNRLDRDELLE